MLFKKTRDGFESRIREQTAALEKTRQALQKEIAAHHRTEKVLKESEEKHRLLETALTEREDQYSALRDVMRQMASRLQHARRMEALSALAGGIAHDFKNILSPIMMYAGMASMGIPAQDPLHSHLDQIIKAGNRAEELVNQLHLFSRQNDPEPCPLMISPILKETLKWIRFSIPATISIKQSIEVKTDTVSADPVRIHELLTSMFTYAIQRMGDKGGTLKVGLTDGDMDSGHLKGHPGLSPEWSYLKLTVSHTDHGMAPEASALSFEPYTAPNGKTSGSELAMIHDMVKQLKGAVFVRSEPEKGAIFEVFLPKIETHGGEKNNRNTPSPKGHERILFIDDNVMVADAAEIMFGSLGYRVHKATSSLAALATFKESPWNFDLVITDRMMPDMTGEDLCCALLRIRPDIPIILCTGGDEMMNEERAKEIGIKAFFTKPIAIRKTAGMIRRLLDQQRNKNGQYPHHR